ncbi:MAG: SMC family ATPase [Chloroflexota bacterium]|nr:SMC family ATPase [Chloroflexota bacterium]
MVPLHLRLFNFLSYRGETELDLRGIHVGCLSGDNGNGKSALLDAVTWALWGWARGRKYGTGGASPDELVHQGQTDMEVALTFAAGEATYRMVRKHSKGSGRRGAARMVDLQAATGDGFRSLTEGSVRETEDQVERLLRMSYETFVNSAFLLQGEADRFTTSKPAQRKETLAEILGLSLYERLQERARERVREQDGLLMRNGLERERAEQDIAERPTVAEALDEAQRMLEGHAPLLAAARAEEAALETRAAVLEKAQEEADRLRETVAQRVAEAERLEAQAEQARARAEGFKAVIAQRDEIYHGASLLADAREQLQELDAEQERDTSLERQALDLKHAIAQAAERLSAEAERLLERAERELRPRVERGWSAEAALEETATEKAVIDGQREAVQSARVELDGVTRAIAQMEADNQRLDTELEELRNSYRMLREGETHCPLCGTRLGEDGLTHLRQELEREGKERRARFDRNGAELALLAPKRDGLAAKLSQSESTLEEAQRRHAARLAELRREAEEGESAEEELASVTRDLDAVTRRLERDEFAQEERQKLAAVEARRSAVAYDPDYHAEVRRSVLENERFGELVRDLRDAEERLPQEQAAMAEFGGLAEARRREAKEAEQRQAEIAGQLEGASELRSALGTARGERQRLETRVAELQGEARLHSLRLEQLAERETELASLREAHAELQVARASFGVLVDAFGRGGIQALLIEAALPELEAQANDLLARLTDHRMTLSLETQRQSRSGNVSETLEIRIADELGTRNYELFSGGEAFRIDFALRVALAKLLASRAGAPLRTLFLDEGFGTQDPGGRERLVEAIQTIQDEFDLILVVTHIEEMKEAFPVRIDVSKDDSRSSLQVVWA